MMLTLSVFHLKQNANICRFVYKNRKQAGAELGQAQPWLGLRYSQARIATVQIAYCIVVVHNC